MPAAARISDAHSCPKPHSAGAITAGCGTVIIGHQPAARVGDSIDCSPATDTIKEGEPSVLIGNKPAARQGDPTDHGGSVSAGCPTVIIGGSPQTLDTGKPFCEDCEKLKKKLAAQAQKKKARQ